MSTRRPKSVLDQDRYTAELSTGQLVIGVCILLMFGLGCFLLGVLIGKFDPTLKPEDTLTASSTGDSGTQPELKAAEVTVAAAPVSPATAPDPELRVPPRMLNSDPERPSSESPETGPPSAPETQGTITTEPAPAEASVASTVEAAAEKNRVAPPSAAPQAVDASPSAATAADPAPAPAPDEAAAWKGYGVQVIAVAKDRAEAARKALESKSSYKARVLPHARNNLYRVVVGPFADQPTALRARDDLRARHAYKDAFVLTLQ